MNPATTLVNDWLTLPFVALIVGIFVAGWLGIWVGRIIREERDRGVMVEPKQVHVERACVAHGHRYVKVPTPTRWRCAICGDVVESKAGWVA